MEGQGRVGGRTRERRVEGTRRTGEADVSAASGQLRKHVNALLLLSEHALAAARRLTRQVGDGRDAVVCQRGGRADARQLQHVRRVHRAGAHDHLATGRQLSGESLACRQAWQQCQTRKSRGHLLAHLHRTSMPGRHVQLQQPNSHAPHKQARSTALRCLAHAACPPQEPPAALHLPEGATLAGGRACGAVQRELHSQGAGLAARLVNVHLGDARPGQHLQAGRQAGTTYHQRHRHQSSPPGSSARQTGRAGRRMSIKQAWRSRQSTRSARLQPMRQQRYALAPGPPTAQPPGRGLLRPPPR